MYLKYMQRHCRYLVIVVGGIYSIVAVLVYHISLTLWFYKLQTAHSSIVCRFSIVATFLFICAYIKYHEKYEYKKNAATATEECLYEKCLLLITKKQHMRSEREKKAATASPMLKSVRAMNVHNESKSKHAPGKMRWRESEKFGSKNS